MILVEIEKVYYFFFAGITVTIISTKGFTRACVYDPVTAICIQVSHCLIDS